MMKTTNTIDKTFQLRTLYHSLNLFYPNNYYKNIDNQTNSVITYIMNDFVYKFEKDFKDKYVVLEYFPDYFCTIAYQLIKHIQSLFPFQLLIYKPDRSIRLFDTYKLKKETIINKDKLLKLIDSNKIIYVSCYNPIYKVINSKKVFNLFTKENTTKYNIIKQLTYTQLQTIANFYGIKKTTKDSKILNKDIVKQYDDFCNLVGFGDFDNLLKIFSPYNIENLFPAYEIELTGNFEKDNKLINEIIDFTGLFFYKGESPFLKADFSFFLGNTCNIPNQRLFNINATEMVNEIKKRNKEIITLKYNEIFGEEE